MDSHKKYFLSETKQGLNPEQVEHLIKHALVEDVGRGDITSQLTIPEDKEIKVRLLVKEACVICGLGVAEQVFEIVDKGLEFKYLVKEGQKVKKGKSAAEISGSAHSILKAERVALNLLSMLSGVATKTREFVQLVEPYKVKITDTRKTMPGLRELQKYAVRIGDGFNHRMSLDEMILIKDNHIRITEGYSKLPRVPKGYKIEIEVQNLDEFKHAIQFKPDVIMLDNMSVEDVKKCVKIRDGISFSSSHHPVTKLEVSGGVSRENVKKIAACGVDIISIGELTHSVESVDISLEVV
ncbi:MAG: carboxylating nicotinate-nucleotide diphosphorylase [Candidatus Omnitrophota bacterium]|jgi:nicotinate-nucleotide pyrophosphorylase (carboxylating)